MTNYPSNWNHNWAWDTRQIYKDTLDFLNLPDDGRQDFPPANERKAVRLASLKRLEQMLSVPIAVSKVLDILGVRQLKDRIYSSRKQRFTPGTALLEELVQTFKPEINTLSRLTQRDLAPWSWMERVSESKVIGGGTLANDGERR